MAVYKIKRYSFGEALDLGIKGGLVGSLMFAPLGSKAAAAGALGFGALGAALGAYNGRKNIKSTPNVILTPASSTKDKDREKIEVNEPTDLNQLFRKYPKLREMKPLIENKDSLSSVAFDLDDYRIIKDWEDLTVYLAEELDLDEVPYLWYNTKYIRAKLKSQDWIACIGSVYFNTKDNNFYLITYDYDKIGHPPIFQKITIKEYGKSLIGCIEAELAFQQKYYKITPQSINVAKEAINTLKRVFKV